MDRAQLARQLEKLDKDLPGLIAQYPGLRGQLLTDDGQLNRFVNVYVNGQDVRYLDGLATALGDRDEVRLLPAMAGG